MERRKSLKRDELEDENDLMGQPRYRRNNIRSGSSDEDDDMLLSKRERAKRMANRNKNRNRKARSNDNNSRGKKRSYLESDGTADAIAVITEKYAKNEINHKQFMESVALLKNKNIEEDDLNRRSKKGKRRKRGSSNSVVCFLFFFIFLFHFFRI